jgi:hypothetical protein
MNTKLMKAAVLLLAGLATATAAHAQVYRLAPAQTTPNAVMQANPNIILPHPTMSCIVQGTPVEFPSDVLLRNTSSYTLPAGKWVYWYLHSQANGWHQLSAPLGANAAFYLNNVIPGGWSAGATCSAQVL